MQLLDSTASFSILGTAIRVNRVDGRMLVLHAPLRLGPGRVVPIRTGATTFQAMVLNASVCALDAEEGAMYELQVEMTTEPASPAVRTDAPRKGGSQRAA